MFYLIVNRLNTLVYSDSTVAYSLVQIAVNNEYFDVCECLLSAGADPHLAEFKSEWYLTPSEHLMPLD